MSSMVNKTLTEVLILLCFKDDLSACKHWHRCKMDKMTDDRRKPDTIKT